MPLLVAGRAQAQARAQEQLVTVSIKDVRTRGWNWNRSQYVEITIFGQASGYLELYHDCRGGGGCTTTRIDPDTCGRGGDDDPEVDEIRDVQAASFSAFVPLAGLTCDWKAPRVGASVSQYHRFAAGGDTRVLTKSFDVDLKLSSQSGCGFDDLASPGNPGGLMWEVRTDQGARWV